MISPFADVLIVGSVNVDLVARVERLPTAGETVTGGAFELHQGGKGANQAVAAARVGARVCFVGAVGYDDHGEQALDDLRSEGVDVSRVARVDGLATGVALIVVDEAGENQIAVASGANAAVDGRLVESALADAAFAPGAVFLANLEVADDALLAGARLAAARGLRIVVNPAPARALDPSLLALRPVLVPNAGEARALSGQSDVEEAARRLSAQIGEAVLVTLGARGALLLRDDRQALLPAPRVTAVDTTGAGDTLAGAFAAQLAAGVEVVEAARFAVAAASLSVTQPGARGGMPGRAEVAALLD